MRWPVVNLRRLAQLGTGHTPSRQHPEYWEDCTIPWLTLADVWQLRDDTRIIVTETSEQISELGVRNSSAVVHPAGTVAMSRTASVGFSCILGADMATSQDFVTWTCGPSLDPRFLLHSLRGQRDRILGMRAGSTHQTIYMPDVEQISTPLPPIHDQRAIADYLDTETARIDALIAKKRRTIELLDEQWIGTLVANLLGDAATSTRQLRRLFSAVTGGSWGGDEGTDDVDARCVRGADFDMTLMRAQVEAMPTRSFAQVDFASRRLRRGDLVIEKSGGGENQPVGRVIEWGTTEEAVPTNFAARLRPTASVGSRYVCLLLRAMYETGRTRAWIKQTTGIQNLDLRGFLSEKVQIPEPETQEALVSLVDAERERSQRGAMALSRQIELLREHRQALITAAVTGELDVPGAAA